MDFPVPESSPGKAGCIGFTRLHLLHQSPARFIHVHFLRLLNARFVYSGLLPFYLILILDDCDALSRLQALSLLATAGTSSDPDCATPIFYRLGNPTARVPFPTFPCTVNQIDQGAIQSLLHFRRPLPGPRCTSSLAILVFPSYCTFISTATAQSALMTSPSS